MPEKFANNAVSLLADIGGMDGVTDPVAFSVENAVDFPLDGNFRILIDGELLIVTSVSGNNFTASRGAEGTQITSHDYGASVRHIFTAGALETAFSEKVLTGPYNNLPSAGTAGRTYICTDTVFTLIDDGSQWIHQINGLTVTPPVLADYTWYNQGTATAVDTYGGIFITDLTASSSSFDCAVLKKALPTAPYELVFGFMPYYVGNIYTLVGPVLFESSSDKFVVFRFGTASNMQMEFVYDKQTNGTTNAGFIFNRFGESWQNYPMFIKITDDGTNRKWYMSSNPYHFPLLYESRSNTEFVTPDEVGFHVNSYNQQQAVHWVHYEESN